jgi:hypothetical protein
MTDTVRAKRTTGEHIEYRAEAFDLFDAKGREFGHSYAINRERYDAAEDGNWLVEPEWVGTDYYEVSPHAMRNGSAFGAIPVASRKRFHTLDEARAYGEQCIAKGRKAAAKKAVQK